MSVCIIFNPAARGEKAARFRESLQQLPAGWAFKPTTCAGEARSLAAVAIREGFQTVVAAGGDGTLNEVLNGFSDVPNGFELARLGVIPLGTINVFARELRLPVDLKSAWKILQGHREIRFDLGCAQFSSAGTTQSRHFIQLAGAGFDARSVELVNWELKKKIGRAAYIVAGLNALSENQSEIEITTPSGEHASGELILIGNGKLYGGNFPLFHKSELQDGLLDAVVFQKVNWLSLPGHLWDFVRGNYFQEGGATYLQSQQFNLKSGSRALLQVEGELVGELPAELTVLPRRLRVAVP